MVLSGALAALAVFARSRPLRVFAVGFIAVYGLNLLAGGVLLPQRPFGALANSRYWIQYFPAIALVGGRPHRHRDPVAGLQAAAPGGDGVAATATVVWCRLAQRPSGTRSSSSPPRRRPSRPNGGDALGGDPRDFAAQSGLGPPTRSGATAARSACCPSSSAPVFGGDKLWTGKGRALTKESRTRDRADLVLFYSAHDTGVSHPLQLERPGLAEGGIPGVPSELGS